MTPAPPDRRPASVSLPLFYFSAFAAVGINLPYLPQHLKALGLSGAEFGSLLSIQPLATVLIPPIWGYLADRTRRAGLLLTVAMVGTAFAYVPLLWAESTWALAACLAAVALFSSPMTTLADSLALEQVHRSGGQYARIRMWGSVGFIVSSGLFGLVYSGERATPPPVIVGVLAGYVMAIAASIPVRSPGTGLERPHLSAAGRLLGRRDIRLLLAAAVMHWLACAPFHVIFTVYLKDLGMAPAIAGAGMALGVLAEVTVMAAFPAIARRLPAKRLLVISFAASALRWVLMAVVRDPGLMIVTQVLHGLTFGAFFISSVSSLTALVPRPLRATGQSLLIAAIGLGGFVGYLAVGRLYDVMSTQLIFYVAAVLEAVPAALVLLLPSDFAPERADASSGPGGCQA